MDVKFLAERYILGQHWGWRDKQKYEPEVQKACKTISGDLFVDIGAHKLFYSNRLAKNFKKVVAFEPNRNLTILQPKRNVELFRTALSDRVGQETFYCYNNAGSDGLIKGFDYDIPNVKGPLPQIIDSFTVTVTTYDHIIKQVADLVKIDVEGEEFHVLNGMNKSPPWSILVELHDLKRQEDLLRLMEKRGYWTRRVDETHFMSQRHD